MKKLIKKLKGFTLIELLAVIVILAVIALIAVPLVINMIEESRLKSAVISGRNYVKAVDYKIAQDTLNDKITPLGEYVIGENELEVKANNIENITGSYEVGSKGVLTAGLCVNGYSVEYSNGKAYPKKDINYCGDAYVFEEPEAVLLSDACKNPSLYDNKDKFKIYKADDLVCLSNLVNSGKTFSGKELYLLRDININDTGSYAKPTTTEYGDINGNGTTEGLLTELTTGAGFKPIGNDTNKFSGKLLGYAYTISNLMINRTTDYVGLFGYSNGTISGVRLRNINIKGKKYVGGVVGQNENILKNVDVEGNVTGTSDYVGGVVGNNRKTTTDAIFTGNVKGVDYVGGLAGSGWGNVTTKGVVYDAKVETTSTSNSKRVGKVIGGIYSSTVSTRGSNITLVSSGSRENYSDGVLFSKLNLLNLDDTLDTYIGGDNDSDGYYFDYDSDGNITIYSADRTPIVNKLKGKGTEEYPYLIKNTKDWKMASATVTQNKYYSLTTDIDFTDTNLYTLGTGTNKFNGHFNGNMKTISNISIEGYKDVAIFGYNTGTIEGLRLNNITLKASGENTGSIASINEGTVNGIIGRNISVTSTPTGNVYAGGIVGKNTNIVKNIDSRGTIVAAGTYVGGVVGDNGKTTTDAIFSGSVKGKDNVGGVAGLGWGSVTTKGVVYDSTIEATDTTSSKRVGKVIGGVYSSIATVARNSTTSLTYPGSRQYGTDGVEFTKLNLLNLDDTIDTYIGGDNDSDGYYFDYDSDGKIILYSTEITPIANTLSGSGTQASPYLIKNINDWKMASATVTQNKYYSLTTDIDFTDTNLYTLGTGTNKFNGHFNGNMKTISNISIEGYKDVAIFGYNTGTIEALRLNNITLKASGENTGSIASINEGTVNGIIGRNISVTSTVSSGSAYVGGIVGKNTNIIKNVDVRGNVTAQSEYTGGIVGDNNKISTTDAIFSGNVRGKTSVGGIAGSGWSNVTTKGAVYNSTIEATDTSSSKRVGKVIGGVYSATVTARSSNVTLTYPGSRQYGTDGVAFTKLSLPNLDDTIDTYIGGDNDSDGYYFDYDTDGSVILYSTLTNPINNVLSGSGTESDPYRIANASDWKKASTTVTQGKYYSLTSDIDFNGKDYYTLGSGTNKFNGYFNGNMNTISNISIEGYKDVAIFGHNTGSIEALRLNNITLKASGENVGTITGANEGTVNGIIARNINVTATSTNANANVGGIVGKNTNIIKNIDAKGTVNSAGGYVGGIVGDNNKISTTDAIFSGNVTGNNSVGGIAGSGWSNVTTKGFVYNSTISSPNTSTKRIGKGIGGVYNATKVIVNYNTTLNYTGSREYGVDGTEISEINTSNVSSAIDTTDNNSDGYYFGMNSGTLELLKSN